MKSPSPSAPASPRSQSWLACALCAGHLACGQAPPAAPGVLEPYHPLVAGAWWEYEHDDWIERVELSATTFEGEPAFLMTDSPNPNDGLRSDATLVSREGRISRVAKQEYLLVTGAEPLLDSSVTYGVGFTRFVESWADEAVGFKETPEYERIETRPGGAPRAPEARRHTFEILSLSEQVPTPIGSFDCIKIRRTKDWQAEADGADASDAQTKLFWFARGVGKVRELNLDTNGGELLSGYSIPE